MASTLEEKLEKIRASPKLQNQQETRLVLSSVEDTIRDSKSELTPTAYFAALLSLLDQFISTSKGIVNKDVATAVVYLLDLVTPEVPPPLLRQKFSHILHKLATVLTHQDADAPLLRPSIGCLESLLVVQDTQGWALPPSQVSPRRAVAGLLTIAVDHRPKVRRRAQEAITTVLRSPPPSPSLDHPAADMCAESALKTLKEGVEATKKTKKQSKDSHSHTPSLIHALQLVKTISTASGGWPSKKLDNLCDSLLSIAKSSNEFLTMAAFEVFEVMFAGMADEVSSAKLPRLLEILEELQPASSDSQLLPPWIAVMSRGYDVAAQVDPGEAFQNLPEPFKKMSKFMSSSSHNIRVSASECLISFMVNCVPASVVVEPSVYDEKTLEKLAKIVTDLLSVKYQGAWMEVFRALESMFETLRWRSAPLLAQALKAVGDLRSNDSFTGKTEADSVISKAVAAMGPDNVLEILPLNLGGNKGAGRAWLLPILRESVRNTRLAHFRSELVPLSENMFQKVVEHGKADKTMEIKIYETIDLQVAFDQSFAEMISNLLYQQIELRVDLCHALQMLVDSNNGLIALGDDEGALTLSRISKAEAEKNIQHLATFSSNLLAVLFNVYTQTLPQYRGPILQCINAYLSITPEQELMETFTRVIGMLESSLTEANGQTNGTKKEPKKSEKSDKSENQMPPMGQTLMDLVIAMAIYLPRPSLAQLFSIATVLLQKDDANLQKKAYKMIPRLAESEMGKTALNERTEELQKLLLECAEKTTAAARRDRLSAEVVICTKETNERARNEAFDLLVRMGERMSEGGTIIQSRVPHMPSDAPAVVATLEEYITMVSAGLAGTVPHSVSASITALTRILYQFRSDLPMAAVKDLVETMDIFIKSPNREIVRSVLGFFKVCVISLDRDMMLQRLPTLIPNLLKFGHEHKAALQAKVKHLFERLIRRFGYATIEKYTPAEDHKLIVNIRKTKERAKRKKQGLADGEDGEGAATETAGKKKGKFENEYDEAVYSSEDDNSEDSGSDVSDDEVLGRKPQRNTKKEGRGGETYIVEDEDEPLDLLDRKALGHISSVRPTKNKAVPTQKRKAKTDLDGKLVFAEPTRAGADADAEMPDLADQSDDVPLEEGINAYVAAIKGRNAAKRGQRGKIKFSNRKSKDGSDDEMEVDEEDLSKAVKSKFAGKDRPRGGGSRPRGGGMKAARMQRRGLDGAKVRGGGGGGGGDRISAGRVGKGGRGNMRGGRR